MEFDSRTVELDQRLQPQRPGQGVFFSVCRRGGQRSVWGGHISNQGRFNFALKDSLPFIQGAVPQTTVEGLLQRHSVLSTP